MKAITTRYVGATDRRPARIIASDLDGNRVTVPADGDFPYDGHNGAHRAAAVALCQRMDWPGGESLIGGAVKHGMVWVFPEPPRLPTVAIGARVYWHDPGDDVASGYGTVVSIGVDPGDSIDPDETIIALRLDSGGEAEVLLRELSLPLAAPLAAR